MLTLSEKRAQHLPAGARKITHTGTKAQAYIYEDTNGRPCARLFRPKGQKPAHRFFFASEAERETRIKSFFEGIAEHKAMTDKRRAERNAGHSLKIGQILYSSWGYDQTNVSFYQVTEVKSKHTVMIREISRVYIATGNMSGKVTPRKNKFMGAAISKRPDNRNCITLCSSERLYEWDGEPCYTSSYA